jgi:long-chain acyl-CoA synthetase
MDSSGPTSTDYAAAAASRDWWFSGIPRWHTLTEIAEENLRVPDEYRALHFDGRFHNNRDLIAGAHRLAGALLGLGVGWGERILINLPNCPEILSSYLAASFVGAVIVPTVPALTIEELDYIVSDCEPTVIMTVRGKAEQLRRRQTGSRGIKAILASGRDDPELASLIRYSAPLEQPATIAPEDLAAVIYTSGTTGKPKGVMLSHRGLSRQACLSYGFYVGPGEGPGAATMLMPLPLCHIFGLAVALAALLMRSLVVMMERFDPAPR